MPVLLLPQGTAASGIDIAAVIGDILPALGATGFGDITDWCSQTELYNWSEEAANRLAHRVGAWVNRYGLQTVNPGDFSFVPPADLVDAIHVSWNGASLRPTTALQLAALDAAWQLTASTPARFSMDALPGLAALYPGVTSTGDAAIIYHQRQPPIQLGQSVIPIASPVQDYFGMAMLGEARRKESDGAMPEMADHFAQRVALYEQIFEHYWGPAQ